MLRNLIVLAAVVVGFAARAEVPTLSASIGYSSEVYTSRSWDLVDDDDHLPMLRVGAGTSFEVASGFVDVEAAFQSGASRGAAHSTVSTDFWLRGVRVGAAYRYPLWRFFQPYVQLGGGVDWATLTLIAPSRLTQTVPAGVGTALVGFQVPIRLGGPVAWASGPHTRPADDVRRPFLVLDIGLGGVLHSGTSFSSMQPEAPAKPPVDPLGQGSVDVGSIPLTGFTFRVLASARW